MKEFLDQTLINLGNYELKVHALLMLAILFRIILLADTAIKVNDVIEVNGLVCQVLHINLRTTTVITRDDKYIILPNRILTNNQVIN